MKWMPILGEKLIKIWLCYFLDKSRLKMRIFLYKVWLLLYNKNISFNFDQFFVKVLPTKITVNLNIMRKQEHFHKTVTIQLYICWCSGARRWSGLCTLSQCGAARCSSSPRPQRPSPCWGSRWCERRAWPEQSNLNILLCNIFTDVSGGEH